MADFWPFEALSQTALVEAYLAKSVPTAFDAGRFVTQVSYGRLD